VVVPILSPDGEWLGHVGRSWQKDAELPYLYGKGLQRRETLYNAAALNVQTDKPVMVVEGVLDALALWPDAVAVLGKPSEPQIWALADAARPVAVVLDGDAWSEGEALAMTLRLEGQRAGSVRLPPKTDPDEVDRGWLDEEVRRCLT
jgi:DNA primase